MENAMRSEVRSTAFRRKFVVDRETSVANFRLKLVLQTLLGVMTSLAVVALALPSATQTANSSSRIEIVEVKNVGISAANDAKSVIQVRWAARFPPETSVKSFDVSVEVRYADRAKERSKSP